MPRCRSVRVAVKPSITGICISIKITSKRSRVAMSTPTWPFSAPATLQSSLLQHKPDQLAVGLAVVHHQHPLRRELPRDASHRAGIDLRSFGLLGREHAHAVQRAGIQRHAEHAALAHLAVRDDVAAQRRAQTVG